MSDDIKVIIKEVIVYKNFTTEAQKRAMKKWYSKPENKEKVNTYYRNRFSEGDEEYKEKIRAQNRERAKRAYYAKKAKDLGLDYIVADY